MNNQQGPAVQHRELHSVMWQPGWDAESGEEWMPVDAWLSTFAVHLKLSQHC